MPKRLSTQTQIKRLRAEGYSRKDIARVTGSSVSAVGRAERGAKGTTIAAPVREFFGLGKRARQNVASGNVALPSAKPAPVPKRKGAVAKIIESVSPLRRAEGQAAALDKDAQVIVQVTIKGTGKSRTLYAHGGVWVGEIKNNLRDAITSQYGRQYDGGFDWGDVEDIDIQEY